MRTLTSVCSTVALLLGAAGCGGPADGPARSGTAAKVLRIDAKSLPKLASAIAPVDEGRLEVAPPVKWYVPPRSRRWLARFQADPGSPYPMIFVTVEDSDAVFHVTRENLEEFAAQVRKELQADPDTKRLVAGLQPVVIGNFRGTLYRRWGKSGARVMERWMLETVANGRRYVFELRSREGLADEYLPHLYAVASRAKFLTGKDSGSALTIIEEAPDGETAEEAPDGETAEEAPDGETAEEKVPEEDDDENDAENVDAP